MASPKVTHLLWLDLETDGSDEHRNNILEVGVILTDITGDHEYGRYSKVCQPFNHVAFDHMDDVVREMHERNGLLAALARGEGEDLRVVQDELIYLLKAHGVEKHRVAMAGSGVSHFDARFIKLQMPRLWRYFKYWQLDTGHVRRFLDFSGFGYVVRPDDSQDAKEHRALADALLHLAEFKHYGRVFGAAFAAQIEQTRAQGMVIDNSLEPVEVEKPDERPEVPAPAGRPSVPEKWQAES